MKNYKWLIGIIISILAIVLLVFWAVLPPKIVRDTASNIENNKMMDIYNVTSKVYQTLHSSDTHQDIFRELINTNNLEIVREKTKWLITGNMKNASIVLAFEKAKGKYVLTSGDVKLQEGETISFEQYLTLKSSDSVAKEIIEKVLLRDYEGISKQIETETETSNVLAYLSVNCKGIYKFNTNYELDERMVIIDDSHYQRTAKLYSNKQMVGQIQILLNYQEKKSVSGMKIQSTSSYETFIPNGMKDEVVKLMGKTNCFRLQSKNVDDQLFLKVIDQSEKNNISHFRVMDLKIHPDGKIEQLGDLEFELPINETKTVAHPLLVKEVSHDLRWEKTVFSENYGVTLEYFVKNDIKDDLNVLYVKAYDGVGNPVMEMEIKSYYENYALF